MEDKFYVRTIIRDDNERFDFDGSEIYLSTDNTLLVRPQIQSSDVEYTDANGGEMIRQRLLTHEQVFNGTIYPRTTDYWTLYFQLSAFFKINHNYRIVYIQKDGGLFSQAGAWLSSQNLQIIPQPKEDYSTFSVGFKLKSSSMFEYVEDGSGNEIFANIVTLPLVSASPGGEKWDTIGLVWDTIGGKWDAGNGGVQDVSVDSVVPIYPVWTVLGPSINPQLQNNTTDTVAVYNATVASGQTLVVDFGAGVARLDGAVVTRNISGQVKFNPGINVAGFNSDGGSTASSTIAWNNVIGGSDG
jgi:hypothetical protein